MPAIQPDAVQAIMGDGPIAFQALHEIQPVKHEQTGDAEPLVIPLRQFHDRLKVFFGQVWPGIAYINKRSDEGEGHV